MPEIPVWLADMVRGFNADLPDGGQRYRLDVSATHVVFRRQPVWSVAELTPDGFGYVLEGVQDQVMESAVGGAWPRCPLHGSHPVEPTADGWACPAADEPAWPYGSMAERAVSPEPQRADGEVRWWSGPRAWGVIAHQDGDLFVHASDVQMPGYWTLEEGEPVEFEVDTGRQGLLRQVKWVRPASRR